MSNLGPASPFVCGIKKFQLFPGTSGMLLFFSCCVCMFKSGREILQGVHNRSDLFWAGGLILKHAKSICEHKVLLKHIGIAQWYNSKLSCVL